MECCIRSDPKLAYSLQAVWRSQGHGGGRGRRCPAARQKLRSVGVWPEEPHGRRRAGRQGAAGACGACQERGVPQGVGGAIDTTGGAWQVASQWLDRFHEEKYGAIAELIALVLAVADVPSKTTLMKEDLEDHAPHDVITELTAALALEASEKGRGTWSGMCARPLGSCIDLAALPKLA